MSNNTLIGALRAEATLESGKFVDGAKKIRVEAGKTEGSVKSMGTSFKGLGSSLAAGLSVGLLSGLIKRSLDLANSIGDVAKQLGITTKELQKYRYAASQVGVDQAVADKGLEQFNETLSKAASGSKTAKAALAAVGVSLDDIKTKSKMTILGEVADQMVKQGGAARNAAAANAVFGDSATKLAPLLDKGSRGISELGQAAERLGIILSDEQIQNADVTAQKLDDVKRVLATQIAGVVADNANSIVSLANALGQLASAVVGFLGSNPTAALAILGAMAGGRFGLAGAAAGALAGATYGNHIAVQNYRIDPKKTIPLLRHNLIKERDVMLAQQKAGKVDRGQIAKVQRLTAKLNEATGNVPAASQPGNLPLPQFLAPSPPKGRKPPKGPRDRSEDVEYQFNQEMRRAQMDTLRAQQSLAHGTDERAALALKILDLQKAEQDAELKNRVRLAERDFAEGKINAQTLEKIKAQAKGLQAEYDAADATERKAIAENLAADKARDAADLAQSSYDLRIEQLQNEASLAETASEKRAAELRILDLMKQQEKARLEAVIADKQSSDLAKAQAQQRLDALDNIYAGRTKVAMQGTRGPWEDWLASLPSTAEKAQEALERLEVQGMEGLMDSAMALSEGLGKAGDSLLETLKNFLLGLARLELQKGMASLFQGGNNPLSFLGSLFGGGSGSGLGQSIYPVVNGVDPLAPLPAFAMGGGFNILGKPGIDKNMLQLNGVPIARVSYGERLNIAANDDGGGGHGGRSGWFGDMNVYGVQDVNGFNRSERQITRAFNRRMSRR